MRDDQRINQYLVWHGEGYVGVFAHDEADAIEEYYRSVYSTIGHTLKICECYGGNFSWLDRSQIKEPTRVERVLPSNPFPN